MTLIPTEAPKTDKKFFDENQAVNMTRPGNLSSLAHEAPVCIDTDKKTWQNYTEQTPAEQNDKKKERLVISKKNIIAFGASILVIAGIIGSAFGLSNSNKNKSENNISPNETNNEAQDSLSTQETMAGIVITEGTNDSDATVTLPNETLNQTNNSESASVTSEYLGEIKFADQTMTLEEMQAITSIEDWAKVSVANRAAYFLLTNTVEYNGTSIDKFDAYASQTSLQDAISLFAMNSIEKELNSAIYADDTNAMKIASASYYYTETTDGKVEPAFRSFADKMISSKENTGVNLTFISCGSIRQVGKDKLTGEDIIFTNITFKAENRDGTLIKDAQTIQIIEVPVRLMSGEEVMVYMEGLGTDGIASPDSNYPY